MVNLSLQMVLLKSRIILVCDLLEISSKTPAALRSLGSVYLQRLYPGVSNEGFRGRSLDIEMAGGSVAGRIRSTQCSRLLGGAFLACFFFFFSPFDFGVKKKDAPDDPASSPESEEPSHFSGVIKTIHELVASAFVPSCQSCPAFPMASYMFRVAVPGQELCCAVECWLRSMLNAISPGISCASSQPRSLCSHG